MASLVISSNTYCRGGLGFFEFEVLCYKYLCPTGQTQKERGLELHIFLHTSKSEWLYWGLQCG